MKNGRLQDFLTAWDKDYKKEVAQIPLFTEANKSLTDGQKILFAHLFYHARGHFDRFLWIMASMAPSADYRTVVIRNITDELGGMDPTHVSHEQLFLKFAAAIDPNFFDEVRTEKTYLPFLREFNEGHIKALLNSNWHEMWSIFAAYELLDNADYNNLYDLAVRMGMTGDALTFFEVHKDGDHFGETFELLEEAWDKGPEQVRKGFDFIGKHQLDMWTKLSDRVFA